jgi:hypothetical protein
VSDPAPAGFGDEEFLTLRIGGSESQPERLLLVGRPVGGKVRVREWTTTTLNTAGANYEIDAAEMLADIQRASDARLPVSEEMYRVRRWLGD